MQSSNSMPLSMQLVYISEDQRMPTPTARLARDELLVSPWSLPINNLFTILDEANSASIRLNRFKDVRILVFIVRRWHTKRANNVALLLARRLFALGDKSKIIIEYLASRVICWITSHLGNKLLGKATC